MAYRGRSRSPPRPSTAPRFAYSGASEHAAEEENEKDTQDHEEDAAESEHEETSMADQTHLTARLLDQATQRISASAQWFIDLKRDVIDATHIPLRRADLA